MDRAQLPENPQRPTLVVCRLTEQVFQNVRGDEFVDVTPSYYHLYYTPDPGRGEVSAARIYHLLGRRSRLADLATRAAGNLQSLSVADLLDTLWVPSANPDRVFLPAARTILSSAEAYRPEPEDPLIWMALRVEVSHSRGNYRKWVQLDGQVVGLEYRGRSYRPVKAEDETLKILAGAFRGPLDAQASDVTVRHAQHAPASFPGVEGLISEPVYQVPTPAGEALGVLRRKGSELYAPDIGPIQVLRSGMSKVKPDVKIVGRTVVDEWAGDAPILGG
jgi:hypothetical protein